MDCKSKIEDTLDDVKSYYKQNNTPIQEQADVIVVLKKGILFNCKYDCQFRWNKAHLQLADYKGWYIEDWGENVLAGMLFHLNFLPSSTSTIQKPILEEYVNKNLKLNNLSYRGR